MIPQISVLIPIYNGERFLQEALDSIYGQTFSDFEIIVVDDGSTDRTEDIIHAQPDGRIKYFKNEKNSGIVFTLNRGLTYCSGKYIARIDADDIAMPDRLQLQWEYMEAHPDTVLLGTSINKFSDTYSFMDQRGGDDAAIRAKLAFDTAINHPSAMFRNDVVKQYNLQYPTKYPHAEDYAFWYTLSQYGKIANLDSILLRYRMHGDNVSMKFDQLQYETMNRIRIKILGDFWKDKGEKGKGWMAAFERLLSLRKIETEEMLEMDDLLTALVRVNKVNPIYNTDALAKNAAWFWYVVYVHENCVHFYPSMIARFLLRKSSIASYLDASYRKKLLVKSLLFWRKK